jgi:hypothetical protein
MAKKLKTIRDYLNTLPEPMRTQALSYENTKAQYMSFDKECPQSPQAGAVFYALKFMHTKEGGKYWNPIDDLMMGPKPHPSFQQTQILPDNTTNGKQLKKRATRKD